MTLHANRRPKPVFLLAALLFARPAAAASDTTGHSFEFGVGSGVNIGQAARFDPYINSEWMNYIPHGYLAWSPARDFRFSATLTKVNARNWCIFCGEKVTEDYAKLGLGGQRRFGTGEGILIGGEGFLQSGTNSYTRLRRLGSDIDYSGKVVDEYAFVGIGLSVESPLVRVFAFGARLNGYSSLHHSRSGTLSERDIADGGGFTEVKVGNGDPGFGFNIEIYMRMGMVFGY